MTKQEQKITRCILFFKSLLYRAFLGKLKMSINKKSSFLQRNKYTVIFIKGETTIATISCNLEVTTTTHFQENAFEIHSTYITGKYIRQVDISRTHSTENSVPTEMLFDKLRDMFDTDEFKCWAILLGLYNMIDDIESKTHVENIAICDILTKFTQKHLSQKSNNISMFITKLKYILQKAYMENSKLKITKIENFKSPHKDIIIQFQKMPLYKIYLSFAESGDPHIRIIINERGSTTNGLERTIAIACEDYDYELNMPYLTINDLLSEIAKLLIDEDFKKWFDITFSSLIYDTHILLEDNFKNFKQYKVWLYAYICHEGGALDD